MENEEINNRKNVRKYVKNIDFIAKYCDSNLWVVLLIIIKE